MRLGEKIKLIREEKGFSQKELGLAVGFSKSTADNRIIQYERSYRIPKKELLRQFAEVLEVNPTVFTGGNGVEKAVQQLFWLSPEQRLEVLQAVEELSDREELEESGNITADELLLWKIQWTSQETNFKEDKICN